MAARLLLDYGHGCDTAGKCSPDKRLLEYKYVREIGSALVDHFSRILDVDVIVPEEKDISLPDRVQRVNTIVDAYPDQPCYLVSLHVNAAPGEGWANARGWSVYVSKKASYNSQILANNVFDAAVELGAKTRQPEPSKKYWEENFYITTRTKCPAILTENFFQNNKEDVELLLSPEGRLLVENIHIIGISKYLGLPYSLIKA